MTEMFKTINNQSPTFMNEIFPQRNVAYNLRNSNTFTVPIVHTVKYGTETVRYRGQRIWHTLSQETKDANSVQQFKNRIKFWKHVDCDCRLCRQYIPQLSVYSFTPLLDCMYRFYELCNFIDLFYLFCCIIVD